LAKKRGLILAFLGLLAGLTIGFGVLYLETRIERELVLLIDEMVAESCDCRFAVDQVTVSLPRLKVFATNPRIVAPRHGPGQKTQMSFEHLRLAVSLREIFEREIIISDLLLEGGRSEGIGPRSATFKFIDFLTAPIPPERDRPDRWKAKLMGLRIRDTQFRERFHESALIGRGVTLALRRTAADIFELEPFIGSLRLRLYNGPVNVDTKESAKKTTYSALIPAYRDIRLGALKSTLIIDDDSIDFHGLTLSGRGGKTEIEATMLKERGNALEGTVTMLADARYLQVAPLLSSTIIATGKLSGFIDSPKVDGTFKNAIGFPAILSIAAEKINTFDTLVGDWHFSLYPGNEPSLELNLKAQNPQQTITSSVPLKLLGDSITGQFQSNASTLALFQNSLTLHAVDATVKISGVLEKPDVDLTITADGLELPSLSVPKVTLTLSQRRLNTTIEASDESEAISLSGILKDSVTGVEVEQSKIVFKRLALRESGFSIAANDTAKESLARGEIALRGPLTRNALQGTGAFYFVAPAEVGDLNLAGTLKLGDGRIRIDGQDQSKKVSLHLEEDLQGKAQSTVSVHLLDFQAVTLNPRFKCSQVSGDLDLLGPKLQLSALKGTLRLDKLELGCEPYRLTLRNPIELPVDAGTFSLITPVELYGRDTLFTIEGKGSTASGYDIRAQGNLELTTLLPFLPSIDSISGRATAYAELKGSLGEPELSGSIHLEDTQFSIESINLAGDEFQGEIILKGSRFEIAELSGLLNNGNVKLSGDADLRDLAQSSLTLEAEQIELVPDPSVYIVGSTELILSAEEFGGAVIKGTVALDQAEFQKRIDLAAIVRAISGAIFRRKQEGLTGIKTLTNTEIGNIALDVTIEAPRNIFFITSFAGAELRARLHITGTVAEPILIGEMQTLDGWFGFKERRFTITTGILHFRPGTAEPHLDLVAETGLRTPAGDSTVVILEANGPLVNPRIRLSSDLGYSEQELVRLITASGAFTGVREQSPLRIRAAKGDYSGFAPFAALERTFDELTSLENIAIEPSFNTLTGTTEPKLIARSELTNNLSLVGESFVSSSVPQSQVRVDYDLGRNVEVRTGVTSATPNTEEAYSADISFSVIPKQGQFVQFVFKNLNAFSEDELQTNLRLSGQSRISVPELEKLSKDIVALYRRHGYFATTVVATCEDDSSGYCRVITVTIEEGTESTIGTIVFDQTLLEEALDHKPNILARIGDTATRELRDKVARSLTQQLRLEGYIGAKVNAAYEPVNDSAAEDTVELRVKVQPGKPVTFIFQNVRAFSPGELLDTIDLLGRKQPFGPNTILILIENIERLYRESGYLYATIQRSEREDETGRITYTITVDEGPIVTVKGVAFAGLQTVTSERLKRLATRTNPELAATIFSPRFPLAEQLEYNCAFLQELLIAEGFPEATVIYEIIPGIENNDVSIQYQMREGRGEYADHFSVNGLPDRITLPPLPVKPLSVVRLNDFLDQLTQRLNDAGYIAASFSTEFFATQPEDAATFAVHIDAGPRTRIRDVVVEGNGAIETQLILERARLTPGTFWSRLAIQGARRRLLRTGLFRKVEVTAADGSLDAPEETVRIAIAEQNLQTLEFGGGINSAYGFHLFGEASDRSFFSDGRLLGTRADLYFDETSGEITQGFAGLRYSDPDFLDQDLRLSEDLRFQRFDNANLEFDLDRVSFGSTLSREEFGQWQFNVGHTVLEEQLDSVPDDVVIGEFDTGTVFLSYLAGTLTFDRRDNVINPARGYKIAFESKLASEVLFSEANYASLGGAASWFLPLPGIERFTIANNTQLGGAWAFSDTDQIPISQRYYLGGQGSIRGFRENSLGPRGVDGHVIGGDLLVANNLELRFRVREEISLHTFFDAGTVYLMDRSVDLGDLRTSVGVGVRYLSPIGPIGLDLGHPLDENPGEPSLRMHFNVGANF
jgi:outer membrane protein insertion porin family